MTEERFRQIISEAYNKGEKGIIIWQSPEEREKRGATVKNCTDNFTENCTDNEIRVLELLKTDPNITQVELSSKLDVSRRTISTILSNLKEKRKIERIGSDRKGYWKVLR